MNGKGNNDMIWKLLLFVKQSVKPPEEWKDEMVRWWVGNFNWAGINLLKSKFRWLCNWGERKQDSTPTAIYNLFYFTLNNNKILIAMSKAGKGSLKTPASQLFTSVGERLWAHGHCDRTRTQAFLLAQCCASLLLLFLRLGSIH